MAAQADDTEVVEIELERGESGLGFNIRGGVDIPHLVGDTGIFVAKIRANGTAAQDGRLKEGDKILEINGQSLSHVTHDEAVSYFVKAGNKVKLCVLPGAERLFLAQRVDYLGSNDPTQKGQTKVSNMYVGLAAVGIAAGLVAVYLGYKYYKANS